MAVREDVVLTAGSFQVFFHLHGLFQSQETMWLKVTGFRGQAHTLGERQASLWRLLVQRPLSEAAQRGGQLPVWGHGWSNRLCHTRRLGFHDWLLLLLSLLW